MAKALIVVDVQNDFVTGSLAVPGAKEILPIIAFLSHRGEYGCKVETFDCHPENHISFKQWPVHCVKNTVGAASALENAYIEKCVFKGTDINVDSYSGFFDNEYRTGTKLEKILRASGNIDTLDIVGIATDYCVKYTALDAIKLGYMVNVLSFACRGVTLETTIAAIKEMKDNKINVV